MLKAYNPLISMLNNSKKFNDKKPVTKKDANVTQNKSHKITNS